MLLDIRRIRRMSQTAAPARIATALLVPSLLMLALGFTACSSSGSGPDAAGQDQVTGNDGPAADAPAADASGGPDAPGPDAAGGPDVATSDAPVGSPDLPGADGPGTDGPGADAAAACGFVDSLDHSCTADADCEVALHQTDCCGSLVAVGINVAADGTFQADETACDATYPGCGCAPAPTMTDSGETATDPGTIQAACVIRGPGMVCLTYINDRPPNGR
jgi:hypothetical protein